MKQLDRPGRQLLESLARLEANKDFHAVVEYLVVQQQKLVLRHENTGEDVVRGGCVVLRQILGDIHGARDALLKEKDDEKARRITGGEPVSREQGA